MRLADRWVPLPTLLATFGAVADSEGCVKLLNAMRFFLPCCYKSWEPNSVIVADSPTSQYAATEVRAFSDELEVGRIAKLIQSRTTALLGPGVRCVLAAEASATASEMVWRKLALLCLVDWSAGSLAG